MNTQHEDPEFFCRRCKGILTYGESVGASGLCTPCLKQEQQPKMETVEEASENLYPVNYKNMFEGMNIGKIQRDVFEKGANWQKEHSYSEQEVIAMLEALRQRCAHEADAWYNKSFESISKAIHAIQVNQFVPLPAPPKQ